MADFLSTLAQWLSIPWVVRQAESGDLMPLITWTLFTLTAGFAVGFIVGKKRAGWVPKWVVAKGFSQEIKQAAREVLESSGSVVIGDKFDAIMAFERAGKGVFAFAFPIDEVRDSDTYQLAPEWRSYLSRHRKYLQ